MKLMILKDLYIILQALAAFDKTILPYYHAEFFRFDADSSTYFSCKITTAYSSQNLASIHNSVNSSMKFYFS